MAKEYSNVRQIVKYQTGKMLIEAVNKLTPAKQNEASNLHDGSFSKIRIQGLDYSNGKGDKTIAADVNVDPDAFKLLAEEVLHGVSLKLLEQKADAIRALVKDPKSEFQPQKLVLLNEQKVLPWTTNDKGEARVTRFTVEYEPAMRFVYAVTVENGWGVSETQATGGTALAQGSYHSDKKFRVRMNDTEMKKFVMTVADFIRAWEAAQIPVVNEAIAQAEKDRKKAASA